MQSYSWIVSLVSNKASYLKIKSTILSRIQNREWEPGDLIPGESQLAKEFDCARATVNRALRELAADGIVERKRKAGTIVSKSPVRRATLSISLVRSEIEDTGSEYRYILISREIIRAPEWLRARLGINDQYQVLHLRCMHYSGGMPYQFEDRWINIRAVPEVEFADFEKWSPNEWLVKHVPYTSVEFRFSAGSADAALAEFLAVSSGEPVFLAERTTWLGTEPVTYAKMSYGRGYCLTART